jgi:adenosylhomocysteine nucleosidase
VSVTGIVAALRAEARTLGPVGRTPYPAATGGAIIRLQDGNLLIIGGMGPEAASVAAVALVAAGARNLLSFGLAGALDPQLAAGAILLPQAVTDGAGRVHGTCEPWRERLMARLGAPDADGILLSVAQPLTTPAAKSRARMHTAAAAVDMESFAIATVAAQSGVNFLAARVVVDTAADSVPRSVARATDGRGEVNVGRLLLGLMLAPAEVVPLVRLAQRYRVAMRALRDLASCGVMA